jgi:poly-gamma-glutamate synthesis protein (capsule biosynthesis protein)
MRKRFWFLFISLFFVLTIVLTLLSVKNLGKAEFIFPKNVKEAVTQIQRPKQVNIILMGDVMLGRSVLIKSIDKEGNLNYPFLLVSEYLSNSDLIFANLESPIVSDCPRFEHGFTFCSDPKMVQGLTNSGINVVTLANNHIQNFGQKGLEETKKHLEDSGISYTGVGNLVTKEIGGTKFGFLGFDFTVKNPTEQDWSLIKQSDPLVDILIVGVHWGEEYKDKANNNQRFWAKKMIENGTDVISGHHPHWVEDDEYIEGKPVFYSLGNFVFDQMWSEETKKGIIVKLTFEDGKIVNSEFKNTYIENIGQPRIITE